MNLQIGFVGPCSKESAGSEQKKGQKFAFYCPILQIEFFLDLPKLYAYSGRLVLKKWGVVLLRLRIDVLLR